MTVVFPGFVSDAGLFADSGVKLPPWVGTRTPEQVAAAVVRGIERERAEVDVAPLGLRVGTRIAGLAPVTVARVQRRLGSASGSADATGGGSARQALAVYISGRWAELSGSSRSSSRSSATRTMRACSRLWAAE